MESYIKAFAHIRNNRVSLNGKVLFKEEFDDFAEFSRAAYRALETKYPKFFKMDNLSKLAFLAADVLLKQEISNPKEENIALVLSNRASSLDTDRRHQKSIIDKNNYFPSPSVFVYTLPNICIGEISIKHKLFSENSFFIFEHFNASHLLDYANILLATNKAEKVLCGWVDFDANKYEAFLYLVADNGEIRHIEEEIIRLYNYD